MGLRSGELGGQESHGFFANFVFSGPLCQFAPSAERKAKGIEKWNKVSRVVPLWARVCQWLVSRLCQDFPDATVVHHPGRI